ncbi:MAG: helix-turn-helix domain-containing protein [Bacteroidales bacterium]|nr:helix-turn-helix domain-containing protein [Bacteroidales bacterium]
MNLEKIRELSEKRDGGLKRIAIEAGMSEQNLHRCLNNNRIQAADLEKIARLLNVPVGYFFDEASAATATASGRNSIAAAGHEVTVNGTPDNEAVLAERVKYLERLLEEKERLINVLMERK